MRDLKPCPFCGGSAEQPYNEKRKGRPIWRIGCVSFCCSRRAMTKKDVIEWWNTRQPDKMAILRERVQAEVDKGSNGTSNDECYHHTMRDVLAIIDSVEAES